jgi:ATP-binding cassette subfamily C protein PrsD
MQRPASASPQSELSAALSACRGALIAIGTFSAVSNVLMLTGSIFMLEVYDRVLPSRSVPTLIALCIMAAFLFAMLALIDIIRSRLMVRVGASLDEALSGRVYETLVKFPLRAGNRSDGLQPLRDLDNVRSFLSGSGPIAFFDLPWLPIYIGICFIFFHFWIGMAALFGAIILIGLTILTEFWTKKPMQDASQAALARNGLAEISIRNAEAISAMGMMGRIAGRWAEANRRYMSSHRKASDVAGGLGAVSKSLRMMIQSGVLAVGAWLVINQQASAGIIIAGSILSARALAPVDLAIANWKGFQAARQGWERLTRMLSLFPSQQDVMPLQAPTASLAVENVAAAPPGVQKVTLQEVSFTLRAGNGLGIIGPSASGKSTLARLIVGLWQPVRGHVRLDGAALDQWMPEALGKHIGYLPQNVELLAGTVAQNISRFERDPNPEAIIAAAKTAGVHDLIVKLPEGYETQVGEQGSALSAGQAQRIALARALYGDPFLVVLDEPNSNLDYEGDEALARAVMSVRKRGGIAVIVAHRPSALEAVDLILVMGGGRMQHPVGPKEQVLAKVLQRPAPQPVAQPATASVVQPLQVVPGRAP